MASIFIYNLKGGKCVELSNPQIRQEDILRLKEALPTHLEGIAFESPINRFSEDSISEIRVEDQESRVAEYLKGIGTKLEQLSQISGALRFYDLAFRLSKNSEVMMLKARTLSQLGQVDRAERLLKRFSKKRPEEPEPYFLFGKHALSRSDYTTAQKYFEKARKLIRLGNVEHRQLQEILGYYIQFVQIYVDRDRLFTLDLPPEDCVNEIGKLQQRTQALTQDLKANSKSELQGMVFFLETQDQIFSKWLEEMTAR